MILKLNSLITLFSIILSVNAYSQVQPTISKHQIDSLVSVRLEKHFAKDSLNLNSRLQYENKSALETIAFLNSVVGAYGVIFSILIGVFAIGLPVMTYFLGIQPAKDAVKELQNNIDKKVENYLYLNFQKNFDLAMENLESESSTLVDRGIVFLSNNIHHDFSDYQYFKIYQVLLSKKLDPAKRGQIAFFLGNTENPYSKIVFNKEKFLKVTSISGIAPLYYSKVGVEKNVKGIVILLKKNEGDIVARYFGLFQHLKAHSTKEAIKFINLREVIDMIPNESLEALKNFAIPSIKLDFEKDYSESYLKKVIDNV